MNTYLAPGTLVRNWTDLFERDPAVTLQGAVEHFGAEADQGGGEGAVWRGMRIPSGRGRV